MSNTIFNAFIQQISDGEDVSICDIINSGLPKAARDGLIQTLITEKELANSQEIVELKGRVTTTLDVAAFSWGRIQFIDTNSSKQIDLSGTTQVATDNDGGVYIENQEPIIWELILGHHYKARTFTIPEGVEAIYNFALK